MSKSLFISNKKFISCRRITKRVRLFNKNAEVYLKINGSFDHASLDKIPENERKNYIEANKELDKFYTKHDVARNVVDKMISLIGDNWLFIEPSAGSGVFLDALPGTIGFDIAPTDSKHKIFKNDFLSGDYSQFLSNKEKKMKKVFVGNPPFGKKSRLAIQFVNKALETGEYVCFIIPVQFRKWSVQSKINKEAKLILDMDLDSNSFEFLGEDYSVRCCFQIWTKNETEFPDIRMKHAPETTHADFDMWQFNRTTEAEKYFDYDWDFAVPRQGFLDYTFKAFKKEDCNRKHQWIFFKAKNKKILKRLLDIDFQKLSHLNTGIPGFGKADVVKEYNKLNKK